MPLIKCTMCGKDISPNAVSCPNCGEPMKNNNNSDSNRGFKVILTDNGRADRIQLIKIIRESTGVDLREGKNMVENVPSIIKFCNTYEEADNIKSRLEEKGAYIDVIEGEEYETKKNIVKQIEDFDNRIKCPNCSDNTLTHKISGMSKATSVGLFGIFALGKVNKTWQCDKCGYRW